MINSQSIFFFYVLGILQYTVYVSFGGTAHELVDPTEQVAGTGTTG